MEIALRNLLFTAGIKPANCEACGHPEDFHHVRHVFVGQRNLTADAIVKHVTAVAAERDAAIARAEKAEFLAARTVEEDERTSALAHQRQRFFCGIEPSMVGKPGGGYETCETLKALTKERDDAKARLETERQEHRKQETTLVEKVEARWRELERTRRDLDAALSARDHLFRQLQALREATMLDPPNDDWALLTPDHLRQFIHDLCDARDRATFRAETAEAERTGCTGTFVHDEYTHCPVHDR